MGRKTRLAAILTAAALAASSVAVRTAADSARERQVLVTQGAPVGSGAPETGTAIVSGVVLDAATGAPVPGALVYLGLDGRRVVGQQGRQITDRQGRFVFVEVPASDRLTVSASRAGYLPGGYSRDEASGSAAGQLVVTEGQWIGGVRIELFKLGSVSGAVVDERLEPVVGVYVRALAKIRIAGRERLAAGPVALTDDRGMYRISGLVPGRYVVSVPSIQASVPASASTAEIAGWTEERLAAAQSRGTRPNIPTEQAVSAGGDVRVVVGPYPVPPPPVDGRRLAYPIVFHPGATTLGEAATIELGIGEHRGQVDIGLVPVPVTQVSGRVEGPPEVLPNLSLRLLAAGLDELGLGSETATAMVAADGSFRFANVPAGTYVIDAPAAISEYRYSQVDSFGIQFGRPPGTSGSGSSSNRASVGPPGTTFVRTTIGGNNSMSGRVEITVGSEGLSGVVLPLIPAAWISGHVRFELDSNQPEPPAPPSGSVRAEPADGSPRLGVATAILDRSDPSRAFTITGLLPGQYLLRAPGGLAFRIKAITYDGRDYTYTPFDTSRAQSFEDVVITMTNAPVVITGSVRDAQGGMGARARVIAFPVERAQWTHFGTNPPRVRSALTTNVGGYRLASLPAGRYYLMAIDDVTWTDWRDPEFFERAAATAAQVTVGWGETRSQDLTVAVGR